MKWTYNKIQDYVRRVRRVVLKKGCRECGRIALSLELVGAPGLTRLARDGYGLARIKADGKARGWFCRSCAKGINTKRVADLVEGWKKEKKQLEVPEPVDKRLWTEDQKWEYIYTDTDQVGIEEEIRAEEVFEGWELEEALEILRKSS